MSINQRPPFIKHYKELEDKEPGMYPNSDEPLSLGSSLGKLLGLSRIAIHHETLAPGHRTSYPHCESTEEEFFYVLEGSPDVWIDGELYRMQVGEACAFAAGTGICHTVINNTQKDVRLLVVGERKKKDNKIYYPLNPERREPCKEYWWENVPLAKQGTHDGLPDAYRLAKKR